MDWNWEVKEHKNEFWIEFELQSLVRMVYGIETLLASSKIRRKSNGRVMRGDESRK